MLKLSVLHNIRCNRGNGPKTFYAVAPDLLIEWSHGMNKVTGNSFRLFCKMLGIDLVSVVFIRVKNNLCGFFTCNRFYDVY